MPCRVAPCDRDRKKLIEVQIAIQYLDVPRLLVTTPARIRRISRIKPIARRDEPTWKLVQ
jgi:hypothetical protein